MDCKQSVVFLLAAVWAVRVAGGTGGGEAFDAASLPAAFPGLQKADTANVADDVRRKLPADMLVLDHRHFVVATSRPSSEASSQSRRIAHYDEQMRRRSFPDLEARPIIVVLADDSGALERLATLLYPAASESQWPASGFYNGKDRLILVPTANGDGALRRQLMGALVQQDNPHAPRWFIDAAATLYESSESHPDKLTPTLDRRMQQISPGEDLSYDVFAGICDCSPVSAEQLALIRLLLIFLDQRDELRTLHATIKQQGQYTTLLQALDGMDFDRSAWKAFAESSVRTYSPNR